MRIRVELRDATATGLLVSATGAQSTASDPQQTEASNGGIASALIDGDIEIGQLVTGENADNSIITGEISGPVQIDGGEIDYPTDFTITQILGPPIALAGGGEDGRAISSDDDSQHDGGDTNDCKNSGHNGQEITFINCNHNRSRSTIDMSLENVPTRSSP